VIQKMDLEEFSEDKQQKGRLKDVIWEFREIFKGIGCVKGYQHVIN